MRDLRGSIEDGFFASLGMTEVGGMTLTISGVNAAFQQASVRLRHPWRLCAGCAEADFRHFALGGGADLEKFALLEVTHAGNNVGGELLNHRVEIADHGVVVAARILQVVFNLIQGLL